MEEDWDFAIEESRILHRRRLEFAGLRVHQRPLEDEPWYEELKEIEEREAILELALGAYELLLATPPRLKS